MTLIPWKSKRGAEKDEATSVAQLRTEMDRVFERFIRTPWSAFDEAASSWLPGWTWAPSMDLTESKDDVVLTLEVPGVDPKDLEISLSGRTLSITGEKREDSVERNKSFHRMERRYGSFRRTVELPTQVDKSSIDADYKNGVLTVKAKKTGISEGKRIEIKVANG